MKPNLETILENADNYLKYFGKKKNLSWFDMSHLLACLFPEYEKEEILEMHLASYRKGN